MKAVVAAFKQEKALVGAFSVITNLRMELFEALVPSVTCCSPHGLVVTRQQELVQRHLAAARNWEIIQLRHLTNIVYVNKELRMFLHNLAVLTMTALLWP